MSNIRIGERFDNKYGQRFTITGFSKDLDSFEERVEFYEVDQFDKWGQKYSEPLEQFINKVEKGKLTNVA